MNFEIEREQLMLRFGERMMLQRADKTNGLGFSVLSYLFLIF
jgi:hypothetical protein